MSRIILNILILGTLLQSCVQSTKQCGLLILDHHRTDTSFDLFLPCEIDEKRTLEDNIKSIGIDTAKWVSLSILENYEDIVDQASEVKDDFYDSMTDTIRLKRIIPVDIEIDTNYDGRQSGDVDFGEYEIKFFGQVISPGYDARQVLTLSKAQIIKTK